MTPGWSYPVFQVSPLQVRSSRPVSPLPSHPLTGYRIEILVTGMAVWQSQAEILHAILVSWDRSVPILSPVSNDVPLIDSLSYTWLWCTTSTTYIRPFCFRELFFSNLRPNPNCWMQAMNKVYKYVMLWYFSWPSFTHSSQPASDLSICSSSLTLSAASLYAEL